MIGENDRVTHEKPVEFEVVSKDGIKSPMKFKTVGEAAEFAKWAFPDQEQDEDHTGKGWDIQVAGAK